MELNAATQPASPQSVADLIARLPPSLPDGRPARLNAAMTTARAELQAGHPELALAAFRDLPRSVTATWEGVSSDALGAVRQLNVAATMAERIAHAPAIPPSLGDLQQYGACFRAPQTASDAATAFREYAQTFHHHVQIVGNRVDRSRDVMYPDGATAIDALSQPATREGLRGQDCQGYALLAESFFGAAGFNHGQFVTGFTPGPQGSGHTVYTARRGNESLLVSNDSARIMANGELNASIDAELRRMGIQNPRLVRSTHFANVTE